MRYSKSHTNWQNWDHKLLTSKLVLFLPFYFTAHCEISTKNQPDKSYNVLPICPALMRHSRDTKNKRRWLPIKGFWPEKTEHTRKHIYAVVHCYVTLQAKHRLFSMTAGGHTPRLSSAWNVGNVTKKVNFKTYFILFNWHLNRHVWLGAALLGITYLKERF